MKKYLFLIAALAIVGSGSLLAQSANDTFTVNATVTGIFTFTVTNPLDLSKNYDFGNVDAAGSPHDALAALTWECNSAPRRSVSISMGASKTAGAMSLGALEVGLPAATVAGVGGVGTSTGFQAAAAGPVSMLTGIANVGNGANNATGNIDLRLTVADTDATGLNTWSVTLTASGT